MDEPQVITNLREAIGTGDKQASFDCLELVETGLLTDKTLVKWMIQPVNLTSVQQSIIETFDIPRKAMMVRNRSHSQTMNAINFTKAMKIAVKRSMRE